MKRILFAPLTLTLASYASPVNYQNKSIEDAEGCPTVTIAHLDGFEKTQYYKENQEPGILGLMSAACTHDISFQLKKLNVQDVLQENFYDDFKNNLQRKSYTVKNSLIAIDRKTLKIKDNTCAPL